MAIREDTQYDHRSDSQLGYVGVDKLLPPSDRVANHALVFVGKGQYRKRIQPVGFYFSKGSMSRRILSQFLKDVSHVCWNVGLVVVNTVSDMGSNNTGTLKEMEVSFSRCVALPAGEVAAGCE